MSHPITIHKCIFTFAVRLLTDFHVRALQQIGFSSSFTMPNIVGQDDIRPLRDDEDQDERAAVRAAQEVAAAKQAEDDRKMAAANVQAHREDRLYNEAIKGQSIAELNREDAEASAADWISKIKAKVLLFDYHVCAFCLKKV